MAWKLVGCVVVVAENFWVVGECSCKNFCCLPLIHRRRRGMKIFSNLACSYLKKVVCIVLFLMGLTSVWKQGYSAREQQKQNKILFRLNFFLVPPLRFSISTWFLLYTLYLIRQKIDCFRCLTEVIVLTHILFQTFVLSFTSEWISNCFSCLLFVFIFGYLVRNKRKHHSFLLRFRWMRQE